MREPGRIGALERSNGLVLLLIALFGVIATFGVVRPRRPSSFSAGSGFGVGYGSSSIMFGATSRVGAAR